MKRIGYWMSLSLPCVLYTIFLLSSPLVPLILPLCFALTMNQDMDIILNALPPAASGRQVRVCSFPTAPRGLIYCAFADSAVLCYNGEERSKGRGTCTVDPVYLGCYTGGPCSLLKPPSPLPISLNCFLYLEAFLCRC